MAISPLMAVALVGIVAVLGWTERGASRFIFALAAVFALASLIALATADAERALLLASLLCIGVVGLSKVKFHHSARALIIADAPLLFAGTVPFFFTQYRRMMSVVVCAGALLCIAAIVALTQLAGERWPVGARLGALAATAFICAMTYRLNGGLLAFRQSVTEPANSFSTFAASLLDVRAWWRTEALNAVGMAAHGLTLSQPRSRTTDINPHIILIQHESVFDPSVFGLTATSEVANFLLPPDGRHGSLGVEIFGGGSWQSEFSVLTGIPSSLFGNDAYFIYQRGVGRFRHSLTSELKRLGYQTSLISSCRRGFLNYDAFYGAIGMDRLIFSDDLPQPFDVDVFEETHSDSEFIPAAVQQVWACAKDRTDPQFFYVLTNFNHGPHNRQLAARDLEPKFVAPALNDPEYTEYYARLTESARVWAAQREIIADLATERPVIVMHYGDHQPVLTRKIEARLGLAAQAERTFRTFFAIEAFGMPTPHVVPTQMPIAYLAPVLLQAAGLPLDAVNATRADLLQSAPFERTRDEARLLRTLVEMRLVDLG